MHKFRSLVYRFSSVTFTSLFILSSFALFSPVSAATVQLDATFAGVGYTTHHNAGGSAGSDYAYDSLVQTDGKIVVVGESRGSSLAFDMAIWRYNSDGTLDTSFNGTGYLTHRITAGSAGYAHGHAVAVQSDGKYVVVGNSRNGGANQMTIWRINTDGTLDTTFNSTGYVLAVVPSPSGSGNDVKLQSDGKIVVVGTSSNDMLIWRYNSNGTLDTTFAGVGYVSYAGPASSLDIAHAVQLQADGKVVVAGLSNGDMAVWRYESNGSADTTFNSTGLMTHHNAGGGNATDQGRALDIQADGKYVVAGYSWGSASNYNQLAVWRVNTNGTLDTTFNSTGYNTFSGGSGISDFGYAVKAMADGHVLVAGSTGASSFDLLIARYDSDGTLDSDFGGSGYVTHHSAAGGNNTDEAQDVEIQTDGKIVAAGYSVAPTGNGYDMAVWRYELLNQLQGLNVVFDVRTRGFDPVSLIDYGSNSANVNAEVYLPGNESIVAGEKNSSGGAVGADKVIADLTIDMSVDRNWQGFSAFSDAYQKRSYIKYVTTSKFVKSSLKVTNIPGVISPNYTLYVPRTNSSTKVYVCPFTTMDNGCAGGTTIMGNKTVYYNGDMLTVTPITKNWNPYWQVTGLTQFVAVTSD